MSSWHANKVKELLLITYITLFRFLQQLSIITILAYMSLIEFDVYQVISFVQFFLRKII